MSYTTQTSTVHESSQVHEMPQVFDNFQKSNEIENFENLEIEDGKRVAKGMVLGVIFSIAIWILIINFVIWVIL